MHGRTNSKSRHNPPPLSKEQPKGCDDPIAINPSFQLILPILLFSCVACGGERTCEHNCQNGNRIMVEGWQQIKWEGTGPDVFISHSLGSIQADPTTSPIQRLPIPPFRVTTAIHSQPFSTLPAHIGQILTFSPAVKRLMLMEDDIPRL